MRFGFRFAALCVAAVIGSALGVVFGLSGSSHAAKEARAAVGVACARRDGGRSVATVHAASETLAFVRYARGSYAIFVISARGGPAHRLSAAPPHALPPPKELFQDAPAWSPDAKRIAFASDRDGHYGIYVMRADGTHSHRILLSASGEAAPAWSPDGREIAFSRGTSGIYVMRPDGRGLRRLTHGPAAKDTDPAWSPDGTRVAFVRRKYGQDALFVVRLDGRGLCELTPFTTSTLNPAWSPNGAMLAYSAGDGYGFAITVVKANGADRHQLTPQALDFHPVWSPDGRRIAFQREATLYVMNADGSHVRRLTRPEAIDSSPAWRPATA
jgi:Tol biopolymer transport system component